ncbi:MAG: PilZ domain-containing protein [Candidatus Eremiobacteraeota bacterium]|nr:PilZ domain-containing protein [Candidatus Eremiobacteraeota bacterium]
MHVAIVQRTTGDRRKERRFPMRGAIEMRATGIDVLIRATLEDLSATGCRVSTRVPLRMTHPVRIELPRPGRPPLRVTGNVVRARGLVADRVYHYGVLFRLDNGEMRDDVRSYVSFYASKFARIRNGADRRSSVSGVDVKLQVEISIPQNGRFTAIAVALRTNGMRIASDRVLRQEWPMKIDLRLGSVIPGESPIVTVRANALPGARRVRGQYVQDVEFCELPLRVQSAIEHFIHDIAVNGGGR